jgi:putative transposase
MGQLFRILQTEWIPVGGYGTFHEGNQDIAEYLMGYYKQERLHSYNNYVTPEMQEHLWKQPKPVSKNS